MSQNLIDHVAILTSSALATAQVNKLKPQRGPEFYAVIAFPPAAGAALHDLCKIAGQNAFGGLGNDVSIRVQPNASTKKPIVGIPGDWLIVRASTQYAPYVADLSGKQLVQDKPEDAAQIRTQFYAGKRVRAALSAYGWTHPQSGKGISFNIDGIMAVEDGERLAIGNGAMVNAFEKFAQAPAASGGAANPFAGAAPAASPAPAPAPAASANPFAQAPAASANPFAQAA